MTYPEASKVLRSKECWCGAEKLIGRAVCDECFSKLNRIGRVMIGLQSGKGLEQAYPLVVKSLKEEGKSSGVGALERDGASPGQRSVCAGGVR